MTRLWSYATVERRPWLLALANAWFFACRTWDRKWQYARDIWHERLARTVE